jgi:hypothetical protein
MLGIKNKHNPKKGVVLKKTSKFKSLNRHKGLPGGYVGWSNHRLKRATIETTKYWLVSRANRIKNGAGLGEMGKNTYTMLLIEFPQVFNIACKEPRVKKAVEIINAEINK